MFLNKNISSGLAAAIIVIYTLALVAVIVINFLSWPKPL
jgi:hypothetical protein